MRRLTNVTRASADDNTRCARHATQPVLGEPLGEPVKRSTAAAPQTLPQASPRAATATTGEAPRYHPATRNKRAQPGSLHGADGAQFSGHRPKPPFGRMCRSGHLLLF